ncbi:hypothetical protein ACMAZF_04765 [Psychrobium sp. nBUS_13]|uniref:hypothetical protein n=1 Tax=Psychrobium sp. nBUS_13 TaxID=3395319 RepID=UPI003EBD2443
MLNKLIQNLSIVSLIAIVAGCATTHSPQIAVYNKKVDFQLPPIAVFANQLSKDLQKNCQAFADESALNYCRINQVDTSHYTTQFTDSKLFSQVHEANDSIEYSIAIATASLDNESAGEISQAALSGLSLLLIPMTNEMNVQAQVSIYWRNLKIKQYDYDLPYVSQQSLFTDPKEANTQFSKSLVSHIIKDLQQDNTLSNRYLTQVLKSSNYEEDLTVPQKIAGFDFMGQYIYNDPLLGSVSTYANKDYHSDKIDLYVYPIRKVNFDGESDLLAQESKNIENEFNSVAKQLEWTDVSFTAPKALTVTHEQQKISGLYFQGEYQQKLGEKGFTSIYLFKLKDKFVKFRATFPEQFITQPISEVFSKIRVPDESNFMKDLRAQGKKQQKNKDT